MNLNQIIVLGCGTSTGVPTLGCNCQVCTSQEEKNKRFRSSILLQTCNQKNIIIDTTPDMRTQLLNNNITFIDAAIITHEHADHTHGIDDLRPFCFSHKSQIPVYTNEECGKTLSDKFPYIFKRESFFKNKKILGGGIPKLNLEIISQSMEIEGVKFEFYELPHGHTKTLAVSTEKFAYIVDCSSIPHSLVTHLKELELDLLIIDCLRTKVHDTHLNLEKSLSYIQDIQPKRAGLTHMSHEFDYYPFATEVQKLTTHLKDTEVFPLYDQQVLTIKV